ncbi:hypothetical protein ACNKHL_14130 [Shigella flexneri]
MVTAGVYLMAVAHGLFLMTRKFCIWWVCRGGTLLLAGFAALVQTDMNILSLTLP